ncbi:adenosine kinase [Nadsonia fulvescens var. elongata DSM 6958]|uniref:Adenosine kinase n=1 Tax=Nadsonia fulvescens var. elongata DSM 6958 TaxID=857566 RepID=A0A1E3PKD9_9ASCO|nr:adenosine kinase [Nadsonia fulvescens var. elongata DSM 6958]
MSAAPAYPLVCLGNPLLDLQCDVDAEYLAKYDLKDNDAILVEDKHMPIFAEAMANPTVKLLAGGAAQNAARGAAYVLPENSVAYFGSVGKDNYAEALRSENTNAGVTSLYQVQEDVATGKCAALISGHERSLVTDLAAANHFKAEFLQKPENWAVVEAAKVFYVGGFHLTVSPPAIQLLAEHAAATNKIFSMNLSAPFLPQFFKEPLDAAAPYWDYLIGNESEALAYAESHGLDTTDVTEIAKAIAVLPKVNSARPRTVIITQGTLETIAVTANGSDDVKVETFPIKLIQSSEIVDTNGAGDAFAGGFLSAIVEGKSLSEAIDVGSWLAAKSIQCVGPSFPQPKVSYA